MATNPKLTVLFEKLRGVTFELDKPELTAGRRETNDICIKDPSLSGSHCTFIRNEDGSYTIRDEDSTNGTRINNVPIVEQKLKNSDIIQLGRVELLFDGTSDDQDSSLGSGTGTFGRTHTINLDSLEANLSTVRELSNYSPFAKGEVKKQARVNKILVIGLAILGLGALAMVVWLLVGIIKTSS